MTKIKVWDGFIRGYHWLQIGLLFSLWYSAENGAMDWHFVFAYSLLALWLTRIVWGLVGSDSARFSQFVRHPKTVINYVRNKDNTPGAEIGHNPAGAYMVMLLLILLCIQLITGLFATDDILSEGPLVAYVSGEFASQMTSLHHLNFNLLLGAIAIHLLAIIVYKLKKKPLVKAMVTGFSEFPAHPEAPTLKLKSGLWAWCLFALFAAAIWLGWAGDSLGYLFY